MRTKYTDPDFRKDPKTKLYCCVCQKDLQPSSDRRYAFFIHSAFTAVHPDDVHLVTEEDEPLGWLPIGPACAKKLGMPWLVMRIPELKND